MSEVINRWNLRVAIATILAGLQLLGGAGLAAAQETDALEGEASVEEEVDLYQVGATALDVTLLRPLGAVTMLGGMVFFVASVPFVAPSERIGTSWDIFVYSSYDYTVLRPLGELF